MNHPKRPLSTNMDSKTVESFGHQWSVYDQKIATDEEQQKLFDRYFSLMNWLKLPKNAVGFDMGCGSGRWAKLAAQQDNVGKLICIDPAEAALDVAKSNLESIENVEFRCAPADQTGIDAASMGFGYSLGVLHHIPDTQQAIADCAALLKSGAPLLLYLYYRFDNKPFWFKYIWMASESVRWIINKLPLKARNGACEMIAALVYFPLAKLSWALEKLGLNVQHLPLSDYRGTSYYRMRHNARDRFGTPLEQRFTRAEITAMMEEAGLRDVKFRDGAPDWCAIAYKA
jgi:ubiquinone/menaquinone biosynthesis C-methylase UbiE